MIKVKQEIKVYETDGAHFAPTAIGEIQVCSHWGQDAWVILVVAGIEYTVSVGDLLAAIENARNVHRS